MTAAPATGLPSPAAVTGPPIHRSPQRLIDGVARAVMRGRKDNQTHGCRDTHRHADLSGEVVEGAEPGEDATTKA